MASLYEYIVPACHSRPQSFGLRNSQTTITGPKSMPLKVDIWQRVSQELLM